MKSWKLSVLVVGVVASVFTARLALALGPEASNSSGQATGATVQDAAQKGLPLTVTSTVSDAAAIQAVLIPASLARRVFGREVSENYAVVELIISNRDPKAALIIHGVFLDYSNWTLGNPLNSDHVVPSGLDTNQKSNIASQVASIDSRLVRGEMIDAQQWSARNWTIRGLTSLGSVAAGFLFPFSGDVAKGVASFNGVVVPGASTLWPDGTVNQINRISDFGFQTNKLIPKQGSDIIVAFFPIERFLTPSFKKLFLNNPSGLFLPLEMIADPKTGKVFLKLLGPIIDTDSPFNYEAFRTKAFKAMTTTNCTPKDDRQDCKLQSSLNGLSLSNLHVVLEGIMTVEVTAIPATIYSVDFDSGNMDSSIWTTPKKDQKGKISGVYLTGGTLTVVDTTGKTIPDITISMVANGSTDTELPFTMNLANCIPPDTKIYFVIYKSADTNSTGGAETSAKQKPSNTVGSTPFAFALPSYTCPEASANKAQGTGVNAQPSGNTTGSTSGAPTQQGKNEKDQTSKPPNPKQQ
jgi:hypothetical protein